MALDSCLLSWHFVNRQKKYKPNYCSKRGGSCSNSICSCCKCNDIAQVYDAGGRTCLFTNKTSSTSSPNTHSKASTMIYTTLELSNSTVMPKENAGNSEKKNVLPVIIGVVVAFCFILAILILVFIWRRRRRKRKRETAEDYCRTGVNLQLKLNAENNFYEQINTTDVESPAYAYVTTRGEMSLRAGGPSGENHMPSSPPYSYVDSSKINMFLGKHNEGNATKQNGVQSPVYFTVEEENCHEYAATGVGVDHPRQCEESSQIGSEEPYYLELEEEKQGGYLEPTPVAEAGSYKELTGCFEKATYQELLKDDVQI